jgi:hypothetical protein
MIMQSIEKETESDKEARDRKPRFQVVKLEERIAPSGAHVDGQHSPTNCHRCYGTNQTSRF